MISFYFNVQTLHEKISEMWWPLDRHFFFVCYCELTNNDKLKIYLSGIYITSKLKRHSSIDRALGPRLRPACAIYVLFIKYL